MTKFLLAVHVIAAILAVGPVAVAASMFPPAARRALATAADDLDDPRGSGAVGTLHLLHRICRVYAVVGVVVPVFGFATAGRMGVLDSAWLIVSIALTALAALVLVALVLPTQTAFLEGGAGPERAVRLAMFTGLFNLLWAAVTVLMIVRPGSTTGA
ncbi:hypothetical protein [Streptomyces cyanogenus]|uniref:Integral membrane protein n=1 Tax=Streptomyces cyanogenus TaxID=80860 RepID=A0ABX7TQ47_STRCY|nr:hypothetical protein [Streptomyces cyanogenus]QTD98782.1 hypothetical protein S1361_15615 [Streptomyces cyanogenus]